MSESLEEMANKEMEKVALCQQQGTYHLGYVSSNVQSVGRSVVDNKDIE